MRFRSVGLSASNMEEYLSKLKEKENNYLEESALAHIRLISFEEKNDSNDEYELLGPKSNYTLKKYAKKRKKRKMKRIITTQYFRKKIFFHHKRTRINSESINVINTSILEQ